MTKKAGRPAFVPTPEQRAEVKTLAGLGTNHLHIARRIGIGLTTLGKCFREELARGIEEANLQVAQSAFNQAIGRRWVTGPDGTERLERCDPVPAMTIFWLKVRAGWREPPVVFEHPRNPLADATDEELEARLEELKRLERRPRYRRPGEKPDVMH
jgi:hypothetical protein